MTRGEDRQDPGMLARDPAMRGGGDFLFAGMGAGGEPQRPSGDLLAQRVERRRVDGERRGRGLQIAYARHRRCAKPAKSLGLHLVLGEAEGEGFEDRPHQPRRHPPARQRPGGEPRIGEQHRNAASVRRQHQIGPQLGFDPDRQIGMPVIEKTLDRARHIDRNELMAGARRQAALQETGRGDRPGGDQDLDRRPLGKDPLDERQDRARLADARGMHPDQWRRRPGRRGNAKALGRRSPSSLPRRRRWLR